MTAHRGGRPKTGKKPDPDCLPAIARLLHELRSPLNAVVGYAELAADESARIQAERLSEHLRDLLLGARQLQAVIDSASGYEDKAHDSLELSEVLDAATRIAAPLAVRRGVLLQPVAPGPAALVRGDRGKLLQILGNLLENAVKFTPPGRRVGLEAAIGRTAVAVAVWDEGPGIAEEEMSRIFQPGVRGAAGLAGAGSGLGLTIARELAQSMGATLEAGRQKPRTGARFTLRLRRA